MPKKYLQIFHFARDKKKLYHSFIEQYIRARELLFNICVQRVLQYAHVFAHTFQKGFIYLLYYMQYNHHQHSDLIRYVMVTFKGNIFICIYKYNICLVLMSAHLQSACNDVKRFNFAPDQNAESSI